MAEIPSVGCFIHSLQLVIHDSIKAQRSVNNTITRSKNIVTHFNHSAVSSSRLADIQTQNGQAVKKLIQDVPTRWNSTHYMLDRLYEQNSMIGLISSEMDITPLSHNEWNLMSSLLSLLKPVEEGLMKIFSSEKCCISEIIPTVELLRKYLEKPDPAHLGVGTLKDKLLKSLNGRFQNLQINDAYALSTAIDPRFQSVYFQDDHRNDIKTRLYEAIMKLIYNESLENNIPSPTKSAAVSQRLTVQDHSHQSFWSGHDEMFLTSQAGCTKLSSFEAMTNTVNSELNMYWSRPVEPLFQNNLKGDKVRTDPLKWWKT